MRDRSRSPIQNKKMQLYSDEIEEKSLKDKRRKYEISFYYLNSNII